MYIRNFAGMRESMVDDTYMIGESDVNEVTQTAKMKAGSSKRVKLSSMESFVNSTDPMLK